MRVPGEYPDIARIRWRDRKLSEFRQMPDLTGFAYDGMAENADGMGVIEAVAV